MNTALRPSSVAAAAAMLDASGFHRALISKGVVSWTVDGRFLRSFCLNSTATAKPHAQTSAQVTFARFNDSSGPSSASLTVALCIFGDDTLMIHCYSGASFAVALPFSAQAVCVLREGIIVQRRAADPSESSPFSPAVVSLFSLLGPRNEFRMVGLSRSADLDPARRQRSRNIMLSPTPAKHGAVSVFDDPSSVLVGAAASSSSRQDAAVRQFVLCWDSVAQRHKLYQCTVLDLPSDHDSSRDAGPNALADAIPASDTERPSVSRPRLSRQPSLSVHRRSSVAVSAAAIAASSRRKSGYGSAVKTDRRGSLLGRVSFNDSPGIGHGADMLREQRQMRAEVVLHMCWKDKRPKVLRNCSDRPRSDGICVVQTVSGKDIVCILNKTSNQVIGIDALTSTEVFRCSAQSMVPAHVIRQGLDNLVVVDPHGFVALVVVGSSDKDPNTTGDEQHYGCDLIRLNTIHQGHIIEILNCDGHTITVAVDGSDSNVSISTRIRVSRLAMAILDSLSVVLSKSAYTLLWHAVVASLVDSTNAFSEMERIASLLLSGSGKGRPGTVALAHGAWNEIQERSAAVLFVLQLVYEDASLYDSEPQSRLLVFGKLLFQLARSAGFESASLFYMGYGFYDESDDQGEKDSRNILCLTHSPHGSSPIIPSLAKWAISAFASKGTRPTLFPALADARDIFDITDSEPAYRAHKALVLLDTFSSVVYNLAAGHDPTRIVRHLATTKRSDLVLSQMRPEFRWILHSTVLRLRDLGMPQWPEDVLRFLGRMDLIANSGSGSHGAGYTFKGRSVIDYHSTTNFDNVAEMSSASDLSTDSNSIVDLCGQIRDLATSTNKSHCYEANLSAEYREFGPMMFNTDLRIEEVERLLDVNTVTYTSGLLTVIDNSEDPDDERMRYMDLLARRVFALPLGQSLLKYSTCNLNSQDSMAVSPPVVRARFRGNKAETEWSAEETDVCWPLFHSGVAAALTLERDQLRQAHSSWVLLHWPSEASSDLDGTSDEETKRRHKDALSTHAGFLFGMGLISNQNSSSNQPRPSGPLCNMPPWQAFKYLSMRHSLTSSALLLGRACAHRGTMDGSLSKILSLHIPNLLPPGSAEMMLLSYGMQAAAMLGLGLLYMKSQNRRMADVMLQELANIKRSTPESSGSRVDDTDPVEATSECYSLASGFALGLVALGQGLVTRTLADLSLLDSLSAMLSGSSALSGSARNNQRPPGHVSNVEGYDIQPESVPSMFDRPNPVDFGNKVSDLGAIAAIGLTFLGTNYKPAAQRLALPTALVQLKAADPFIVMWKTLMQSLVMLDHIRPQKEWVESKYAGTEDLDAQSTILSYFDHLASIAGRSSLGYESGLTRLSAQQCLDIMCISAALVMAGSGNVEVMRRLRALHGISSNRTYGNHMASHMALGILFLGGGARFTISSSIDSIALLLIAFFPRFPQHYSDNGEHLQAWRHLWSLCVEPRCLVVRDATTGCMCKDATATIFTQDDSGNTQSKTDALPVTMLALKGGLSMRLQAPGYISLLVNLDRATGTLASTANRTVVYMQSQQKQATSVLKDPILSVDRLRKQYNSWLECVQEQVLALTAQLAIGGRNKLLMNSEEITQTLSAVETLRVFVQFSASPLFANATDKALFFVEGGSKSTTSSSSWVETTYLAWLSVRRAVLEFGCSNTGQRVLQEHWSGSMSILLSSTTQQRTDQAFFVAIGLLYTVLDLPRLPDVQEITKHVPVSSLVSYLLSSA
ncbi:Anaphase-promoting complex subunit 1 [Coemansia sp. RSA 1200]|nr:Anaphase-promoting complex subunit 1 [Coemansia sp. RSA 1200]